MYAEHIYPISGNDFDKIKVTSHHTGGNSVDPQRYWLVNNTGGFILESALWDGMAFRLGGLFSKGVGKLAKYGDQIGSFGKLIKNPGLKWVGSREHALNRMAKYGISEKQVMSWIKNGKVIQQDADTFMYVSRDGVAILDKAGELQTVYGKNQFKDAIKSAIDQLFGK